MATMIGRPDDGSPVAGEVRLGKYVLEAPLGAGGMAEVFRARTVGAEGFQRPVAIKRVLPDASKNPAFSEMFVAEAKLSSRMQHPNIVSVLDFDRDHEGRLYLVMELVEGRDLAALIESGPLPYEIIIYTIAEVLRGLGYAHDLPAGPDGVRGLIHRDVSPHNVLCAWSGAVKVSDFGIAKAREATAATGSQVIKGKPAYMSPEQINGAPLDGRSDLFAVGVMLWQMLTGQPLFAASTLAETFARVLFNEPAPPSSIVPGVPPDLEAVALRLLAKEPALRFQTAEDAIEALLHCRDAPRDGRRALERLLVERFPEKAHVRTGQRSRSGPPALAQGTPGGASVPPQARSGSTGSMSPATVPGYIAPGTPPPAVPVSGAVVVPRSRRALFLALAVVAAAAIAIVVAIVRSGGGGSSPAGGAEVDGRGAAVSTEPADAASGTGVLDAGTVLAPPDAALDALTDAPAPDAAAPPLDAAWPDARRRPPRGGRSDAGAGSTIHDFTPGDG